MTKNEIKKIFKPNVICEISFKYDYSTGIGCPKDLLDSVIALLDHSVRGNDDRGIYLLLLVEPKYLNMEDVLPHLSYHSIYGIKKIAPEDLPLYIGRKTTPLFEKMLRGTL